MQVGDANPAFRYAPRRGNGDLGGAALTSAKSLIITAASEDRVLGLPPHGFSIYHRLTTMEAATPSRHDARPFPAALH